MRLASFKEVIGKNNAEILSVRGEKLNLYIIFNLIINNFSYIFDLNRLKFEYILLYIKLVDPKLVITYCDNDPQFYKLKKFFYHIKFISVQNGYRFYKSDLFSTLKKKEIKNLSCDYIFCFNEFIAKFYEKFINCKTVVIGSVKNNSVSKSNFNKDRHCLFVSSYGVSKLKIEKKILNIINNFCKENSLQLKILSRRGEEEEKKFYLNINPKLEVIEQSNDYKTSYKLIDKALLVVSLNNTLGYESISRNNKTIFLNLNDREINCSSYIKYAWPMKFKDKGPFWTNNFNENQIKEILEDILKMKNSEWNEISKKFSAINLHDNLILHNIINKSLN